MEICECFFCWCVFVVFVCAGLFMYLFISNFCMHASLCVFYVLCVRVLEFRASTLSYGGTCDVFTLWWMHDVFSKFLFVLLMQTFGKTTGYAALSAG